MARPALKKSVIGWEPYYNEILAAGNLKLAAQFVPKCMELRVKDRVEMWVKCNMIGKAAEEAGKAKDLELLKGLRAKAGEREATEVERWINILQKK